MFLRGAVLVMTISLIQRSDPGCAERADCIRAWELRSGLLLVPTSTTPHGGSEYGSADITAGYSAVLDAKHAQIAGIHMKQLTSVLNWN